jgi:flagellar biosynthesis protein FlhA
MALGRGVSKMNGVSLSRLFSPTVLLALALMAVIAMMILPMPAWVLDLGLSISFGLAILIFTITLFVERPLEFSSFPTILLASLMLRLSLNVSSTKLIIGQGHTGTAAAGQVIEGFAQFVMGGSVFLGLVVFGVLMIVNFVVITKGAARMAEVGARFALDAMPGKQLAIDSDMAAGAISHDEARERRALEQQETTFFGSLDGASKFVKGDAVAGLLITMLNLVMGLIMGTVVHGMEIAQAFETYAILTVGDGLVTQVPAVIISISAALLLARGGDKGAADLAVFQQIARHPAALTTVAFLMGVFAFVPGLPFLPFIGGGMVLAAAAYRINFLRSQESKQPDENKQEKTPEKSLGDILDLDDLHVEFASDLVAMIVDAGTGLDVRITNMRTHVAKAFGLILPEIRLTDRPELPPGNYVVKIHGVEHSRGILKPDLVLALLPDEFDALPDGQDVTEPVYGADARWIAPDDQEMAILAGATVVAPAEILATHLIETVKRNFPRLLTLKSLRRLLTEMTSLTDPARSEANQKLVDELVPDKVPMDCLLSVLRLLLHEGVSIRNLLLILEAIAEARLTTTQPELICEIVRQRISFQLIAELRRQDGSVPLVQLAPEWEERFASYQIDPSNGLSDVALPPDMFNLLAEHASNAFAETMARGVNAALITSAHRRRFICAVLQARGINNSVLSFDEIGPDAKPALVGTVAA